MSSNSASVQVSGLSKAYTIYNKPVDRLKQSIVPRLLRIAGKSPRVYYHEFWALRDISLDVHKGETVGVIGRNGSGKSTLLQLICGTLTPTSGEVKTHGRIAALLELGSGFNPEFTGRENVFLNGAILGLSQEEIVDRFDAIAAFADIGEFIEQPVKFYSSGMMVRLAFAVQAMVDPDILIVDEALAVGDEQFQRKCFQRLEELRKSGTSILFVSHSSQQIAELCNRVLLLERGQRILMGEPLPVLHAYQRLSYASLEEHSGLIEELKRQDAVVGSNTSSVLPPKSRIEAASASEPLPPVTPESTLAAESDFFEGGLISQSAEFLPERGARIENIQIFNSREQLVNNLIGGKEYFIKVQGIFFEDYQETIFGIHLRTTTGIGVAGLRFPSTPGSWVSIKKGQQYVLTFPVKMLLLPGIYFIGSATWSSREPAPLHQVSDFVMFRVLPQRSQLAYGYFDISAGIPEFKISD